MTRVLRSSTAADNVTAAQEMLPAKPVFFRYVAVLCGINAGAVVGACLLGLHVRLGYCLYGLAELLYNALLPPVRNQHCSTCS